MARPTIGVVTTVGLAHTELFGSLAEIVKAKGELIASLPPQGTAVLNADVPDVAGMGDRSQARVLTFGRDPRADVSAESVRLGDDLRARFRLRSPWGAADVQLTVAGEHQVTNALAAASAALALDVPVDEVADGLGAGELSPWRMDLQRRADGLVVLNDAYNANPTSMAAALRALVALPATRRVAVLGEMAELGADAGAAHRAITDQAIADGVEVIAVAAPAYGGGATHVADRAEALAVLDGRGDDTAILVKGSRVAGLEALAADLLEPDPN